MAQQNNTAATGESPKTWDVESRRLGKKLAAVFMVLAGLLALGGYFYLSHEQSDARATAHQELSAIADLKLHQISQWRKERLSDARFFYHARFAAQDVQNFLLHPDSAEARSAVLDWLKLLKGDIYNGVVILDAQLKPRLGLPDSVAEPVPALRSLLEKSLRDHDVVMSDLNQDQPNGLIHLDLLIPIFPEANPGQGSPIAVILFKIDTRQFLFPLIQSWPTPSRTAETLLVRQEQNDVLYLNDLRHLSGTALRLKFPLASAQLPAAQILRGETKVFQGIDYRGVPVVAAGRIIPGTPWAMLAKMDEAEIYAPLHEQLLTMLVVLGALFVATALFIALLWRQRSGQFLQRQLAVETERAALAERVAHLMRYANDIILLFDPAGRVIEANECALKNYGYTLAEIQQKHLRDLRAPEGLSGVDEQFERVKTEGSIFFETMHQRKDGSTFPVEVSSQKINVGHETFILSIIRDITQRQAHEREIERLNRLYAALSEVNQAVVRATAREELIQKVCRVLVDFGGFQMAWIGWVDPTTSQVVPIAQFGDRTGYLQQIRVFADDRPEGQGPAGICIRESRPCVCNDVATDPKLQPWRDALAHSGWRALAAFPISQEGIVRGALAVYSQQKDFFGAKEQSLLQEAAIDVSFGLDKLLIEQRRREAEADLRALNNELEQRVRRRTADLEAKNKSLEAFTYSVSHDLKNPLRSIAGFSDVLLATVGPKLEAEERQILERVIQSATRMNRLIDDLLAYSRLELQEITCSEVALQPLVDEILREYQPEILGYKTRVEVAIDCAPLGTDASGLTQAMRNLIGNAIKFSAKAPQPVVQVKAHDTDDQCVVEIRDNGIGFDMQFREKIFDMFERLHKDETYPGTGIGLAIVRRAIARIGGRVWAESEPGQGAAFFVRIPRKQKTNGC